MSTYIYIYIYVYVAVSHLVLYRKQLDDIGHLEKAVTLAVAWLAMAWHGQAWNAPRTVPGTAAAAMAYCGLGWPPPGSAHEPRPHGPPLTGGWHGGKNKHKNMYTETSI